MRELLGLGLGEDWAIQVWCSACLALPCPGLVLPWPAAASSYPTTAPAPSPFLWSHPKFLCLPSSVHRCPNTASPRSVSFGQSICFHHCVHSSVTPSSTQLTFLGRLPGPGPGRSASHPQIFNACLQLVAVCVASSILQRWKLRLWSSGGS